MEFSFPEFRAPDFSLAPFASSPDAVCAPAPADGVAPARFHSTSMFPEYVKVDGAWRLVEDNRMDCVLALDGRRVRAVEPRRLKRGDPVVLGRTERAEEGIYVYADGFTVNDGREELFSFRRSRTRETAYSRDYDQLYSLLEYERAHGSILWVLGPAVAFDRDARLAMQRLIEAGYCQGLLAGNALATHDLEAGLLGTALGQDIYTQRPVANGHYHHLDVLNAVRGAGGIPAFLEQTGAKDGIMRALIQNGVPYVLAGSIRDDGPLPEVCANVYESQDHMRELVRRATTILCVATQLHTIATGNMTPCYRVCEGVVRPLFLYTVDVAEFAVNKLGDRGSLSAKGIIANAQDFLVNVARGVGVVPHV